MTPRGVRKRKRKNHPSSSLDVLVWIYSLALSQLVDCEQYKNLSQRANVRQLCSAGNLKNEASNKDRSCEEGEVYKPGERARHTAPYMIEKSAEEP
jgi:hypothetical protein